MYELEKIKVQSLHHKTHVAELWHGQTDAWEQHQAKCRPFVMLHLSHHPLSLCLFI